MKFVSILISLLLAFPAFSHAQKGKKRSKKSVKPAPRYAVKDELSPWSLSFNAGLTQFFGELNEQDMKGAVAAGVGYKVLKPVSIGFYYSAGKIGGEKKDFFNSYFINEYNTFELLSKWSMVEQFSRQKGKDFDFSIYGGLGLMRFSANAYDLTTNELLRFTNSSLSKRNQLFLRWGNPRGRSGIRKTNERVIPLGFCMNYSLLERWKVGMDYRFYFIRTDKADATSGWRLINPEEQDSYSNTPNDKFSLLSVSLTHHFTKSRKK